MLSTQATLWVVATPLGNLGDLSPRARDVLEHADVILAEDTRRTGLLFVRAGLPKSHLLSLHEHNESSRIETVLGLLRQGRNVAVVSDDGTPLVADPGYKVVRSVRDAGFPVVPVPGPAAPVVALMACGLPPYPFVFLGFLPRKPGDIRKTMTPYAELGVTLVYFERKSRVAASLGVAFEVLGDREFCLARELTKEHEQFIHGRLCADCDPGELRGEVTVVIGPPDRPALPPARDEVLHLFEQELGKGGKPKQAAKRVAEMVVGWSAKEVYGLSFKG